MYFSWIPDHLFQGSPVAVPMNEMLLLIQKLIQKLWDYFFTRLFYKPMSNAPCKIFSRINRNCLLIVNNCCVVSALQFTPYHAGLSLHWTWTLMVWQQLMSHVISHGIDCIIVKALFSIQMALYRYLGRPNSYRLIHIMHVSMGCMAEE